ncbi:major capsid protein [Paracoccus beibuensis]
MDFAATETVQVDRESYGHQLLGSTARDVVAAATTSSRKRGTYPINSQKIGDKVVITASDFRNLRKTGELSLEDFQSVLDKRLVEKFGNIDMTQEFLRISAVKGFIPNLDDVAGAPLVDFFTLYGIARPAVLEMNLGAASPKAGAVRQKVTEAIRAIKAGLGAGVKASKIVVACETSAFDALRETKELRDAFQRAEDGSYLWADGTRPVVFGGVEFFEYTGIGLDAGEMVFIPLGVPGMLKTVFTPADHIELVNEEGIQRVVMPARGDSGTLDFGKGWEAEVASFPVHYNLRPEAVVRAVAGTVEAPQVGVAA